MSGRPPIWIISLERATDRRAFVRDAFDSLGVEYEIVDAVDGRALDDDTLRSYSEWRAVYRSGRGLGRGMVAAAMSHLRAYERMAAERIPEAVIIEDDVRPHSDFLALLDARDELPDDWDVVTFHSLFEWAAPRPINDVIIAGKYRICSYASTPMGAQAYVINQHAAHRLLEVGYPVCLPPDELLFRRRPAARTVYGIEPSPVVHEQFGSEIHAAEYPASRLPRAAAPLRHLVRFVGRLDRRLRLRHDQKALRPPPA